MKHPDLHTVIVGDLIGSSKLHDRPKKAAIIRSAIEAIVEEFAGEFYAPLVHTKGMDELSGVLIRPKSSYQICTLLNEEIFPLQFRYAVVQDRLDVELDSADARRMDGVAFHKAAVILADLKVSGMQYGFQLAPPHDTYNPYITQLANLASIIIRDRTQHQNLIVTLYRKHRRQKDVGDTLGIKQQAVSESLGAAHWKDLKLTEKIIGRLLDSIGPDGEIGGYGLKQPIEPGEND